MQGRLPKCHALKVPGRGVGQDTQVLEMSSLALQISLGLSDLLGQLSPVVAELMQAEAGHCLKQAFI